MTDSVKLLLQRPDIDITVKDSKGKNFIDLSSSIRYLKEYELQNKIIENNRIDIITLLNQYNLINPKIKEEHPNLHIKRVVSQYSKDLIKLKKWITNIKYNDINGIKRMIENGMNINVELRGYPYYDNTALMYYSRYNQNERAYDILKLLIESGADLNKRDTEGNTALHYAAIYNLYKNIKLLIESGADVYIKNYYNKNFIDLYKNRHNIIDFNFQNKFIKNNIDILIFFNKYGLVHPKIKDEHPELFKAKDCGLI